VARSDPTRLPSFRKVRSTNFSSDHTRSVTFAAINAEQLVTAWNEREAKRSAPRSTAGYWFLRARCPACRTTGDVDLWALDWHRGAAVTALTPALSCRSCRPNAPFAELICLRNGQG
jgi:hypothetical protein